MGRVGEMSSDKQTLPPCGSNEEEFMGMCYKKCSLLTHGKFSHRILPNACCKPSTTQESRGPCASFTPSDISYKMPIPGQGYTIGGDTQNGTPEMPHPTGSCDSNEEGHLGWCFKKCSLLTNGKYPYRVMANTRCKKKPCWNIFNIKTRIGICSGFGVGGGQDGHDCPHPRDPHGKNASESHLGDLSFGDFLKR